MKIEYIESNIKISPSTSCKVIKQINITFEKIDISDIILDYLGRNGYLDDIFNTKIKFKYRKICVYKNYHKSTNNDITKQTGTKIFIPKSKLGEILLKFISDNKETYIKNNDIIVQNRVGNVIIDKNNKKVVLYILNIM